MGFMLMTLSLEPDAHQIELRGPSSQGTITVEALGGGGLCIYLDVEGYEAAWAWVDTTEPATRHHWQFDGYPIEVFAIHQGDGNRVRVGIKASRDIKIGVLKEPLAEYLDQLKDAAEHGA